MMRFTTILVALIFPFIVPQTTRGAEPVPFQELPAAGWTESVRSVKGLPGEYPCLVAYPEAEKSKLVFRSPTAYPSGLYRFRLTLSPSDVSDHACWSGAVVVASGKQTASLPALFFGRVHVPQTQTVDIVHAGPAPLLLELSAVVNPDDMEQLHTRRSMKTLKGPSEQAEEAKPADAGIQGLLDELEPVSPQTHYYFLLHKAEVARLAGGDVVKRVDFPKIRYAPGETLRGTATLESVSGSAGGAGTLRMFLKQGINDRTEAARIPVPGGATPRTIPFEVSLPTNEYGYEVEAEFEPADGSGRTSASDYFIVASHPFRAPIYACTHGSKSSLGDLTPLMDEMRRSYINCLEVFFWGIDDMLELSPDTDWWFSGQATYHCSKEGMRRWIQQGRERGIGMISYGKFIMSGYPGWEAVYAYPDENNDQYNYPVGMWETLDVGTLDILRNKEFGAPVDIPGVTRAPEGVGVPVMTTGFTTFMPVNPDCIPSRARAAAEEFLRSIDMFGWDGVRWDGHPRGIGLWTGQLGGSQGKYDYDQARQTQLLVRYFKDIVGQRHPSFVHGYNYWFVPEKSVHETAIEDFEMEELASGNGLLMNEHFNSAVCGRTYEWAARAVQVEGDMVRERGGRLLLIAGGDWSTEQDRLALQVLSVAGGACNYGILNPLINRYATRYAAYIFDDRRRRLERADQVLKPTGPTDRLWWSPFVYEMPRENGREQVVVNLLNLATNQLLSAQEGPDTGMKGGLGQELLPASDPVDLDLALPEGYRLLGAHLINPFTLEQAPVAMTGNRVALPSVRIWSVLVLDLEAAATAPRLADLYGPPKTLGVERPDVKADRRPVEPLPVDKPVREVNENWARRFPPPAPVPFDEDPALAALDGDARNRAILTKIGTNSPASAGAAPAVEPPPGRNGSLDVLFVRGGMDHRLRFHEALGHVNRFSVREALLSGGRSQYSLNTAIDSQALASLDAVFLADIPFPALGKEPAAALVRYVRGGGGVFFTGGEYAFGKGGYAGTGLERDLLPVLCQNAVDTRYAPDPLALEAGPEWNELGIKADFSTKPSVWCWNEVAVKPGAGVKVFLKAGNRPILVGWQVGQGRVVCLLATHRGRTIAKSGSTAFFDWTDWPAVEAAALKWAAPDAFARMKPEAAAAPAKTPLEAINEAELDDLIEGDGKTGPLDAMGDADRSAGRELDPQSLKEVVAKIRELAAQPDVRSANWLARQAAGVANLPERERGLCLDGAVRADPVLLDKLGRGNLANEDPTLRGIGYELLAVAGSEAFPQAAHELLDRPAWTQYRDVVGRRHAAMALCRYGKGDLVEAGRKQLFDWRAREERTFQAYTGGKGFSQERPETFLLPPELLVLRLGWLSYMARHEPEAWTADLVREWLMTWQYEQWCDRQATQNLDPKSPKSNAEVVKFRPVLARLRELIRPQVDALAKSHPKPVADGLRRTSFRKPAFAAVDWLGQFPAADSAILLQGAKAAPQDLLAEFAAARLATP